MRTIKRLSAAAGIFFLVLFVISVCPETQMRQKIQNVFGVQEVYAVTVKKPVISSVVNDKAGVLIKWKQVSKAKGYYIYRNGVKIKTIKNGSTISFLDRGAATGGTKYSYRVAAYRKVSGKIYTSPKSIVKSTFYLSRNKINYAWRKGGTTTMNWTAAASAGGYQVQYASTSMFSDAKTINFAGTALEKAFTNLAQNQLYYVRVRAYRQKSYGTFYAPWSDYVKIIAWNPSWEFAGNSVIHSDSATVYYSRVANVKNRVICVNAGHGTSGGEAVTTLCHPDGSAKVTGGSTSAGSRRASAVSSGTTMLDGTSEATVNLALARILKDKLLANGYHVLMIRENEDVQLDNIARTVIANNMANCHIALHYDSTTNNKGAFYISVPNVSSYRSMYPVSRMWQSHNALGAKLIEGMRNGGARIFSSGSMEIDLTQTSYSTVPSIDLEIGDRASDYSTQTLQMIADGIVAGLNQYYQ